MDMINFTVIKKGTTAQIILIKGKFRKAINTVTLRPCLRDGGKARAAFK